MPAADPPNAANYSSYEGRMLVLPTGEVLFTIYDGVQIYTNPGPPQNTWRPAISSSPANVVARDTYSISGTLFNGFSEGAFYGDDAQMATNYPLVRIQNNATGHVFYARTHDHSQMGVESVGSATIVTTHFDVPAGIETGSSTLYVVANGIASAPVSVTVSTPAAPALGMPQAAALLFSLSLLGVLALARRPAS
jgi:hypothetical protein